MAVSSTPGPSSPSAHVPAAPGRLPGDRHGGQLGHEFAALLATIGAPALGPAAQVTARHAGQGAAPVAPGAPGASGTPAVWAAQAARADHHHDRREEDDKLDPRARHAAQLAPPPTVPILAPPAPPPVDAPTAVRAHASLEELLPALVRRVAWGGDGKRGTVRMELGAGELSGATLLVSSDAGRVSVQLTAPPGTDASAWKERLRARLEARGLSIESLEVT